MQRKLPGFGFQKKITTILQYCYEFNFKFKQLHLTCKRQKPVCVYTCKHCELCMFLCVYLNNMCIHFVQHGCTYMYADSIIVCIYFLFIFRQRYIKMLIWKKCSLQQIQIQKICIIFHQDTELFID